MCGIAGVVGGDAARERERVARMTASLAHRGPDDSGFVCPPGAVLGNRRLAILDPSPAGRQPMTDTGGLCITYNGEIYNHRALRSTLERAGEEFRTGTDTEVLLALFRREGAACLARLRGMFAFAVWDPQRRRLFAARDAFGQKPFHYAIRDDRLIFASEIKAILAHGDVPVEPDPFAAIEYLSLRYVASPRTMFRGIRKLPAGHSLEWSHGEMRVQRWWSPPFTTDNERSDQDWTDALRSAIDDAVSAHLVSDVPVGAFLSGGLDSSVVVSRMSEHVPGPFSTFCVGSDAPDFDERPDARVMAAHVNTAHHETAFDADLLERVSALVRLMDEPSDPIAACIDAAAALAAQHVKVVLGGDGGDEVFAGFDRYAAFPKVERYATLPAWLRDGVMAPLLRRVPDPFGYKSAGQRARWLASVAGERGGRLYARMTSHFRFGPAEANWVYGPALLEQGRHDALDHIANAYEIAPASEPLDRMLYADLEGRLPEHTLLLADRLGMAHGLEIRAPLLDTRLAELCFSMPASVRLRGGRTKAALRRAVAPWIPQELLGRAKQGFMLPIAQRLAGNTMARVVSTLRDGALVRNDWIRADAIDRLATEHESAREDHHVRIWQLLSLDAWLGFAEGRS